MGQDVTKIHLSITEAREILGEIAVSMSDNEIEIQLENLKYLAESWIDNFEKSNF
jgi:hypothetical protein